MTKVTVHLGLEINLQHGAFLGPTFQHLPLCPALPSHFCQERQMQKMNQTSTLLNSRKGEKTKNKRKTFISVAAEKDQNKHGKPVLWNNIYGL